VKSEMQGYDLGQKTVLNVSYNTAGRATTLAVLSISNIILMRTLSADDYGVFGFANIFVNFMWMFNDFGVNTVLVQRSSLEQGDMHVAFSIKFVIGLLTTCIVLMMAPLTKLFLNNAEVADVIRVLSVNFILAIFCFIPQVLLTRKLDYKKLTLVSVVSTTLGAVVSILMAKGGYSYWSLVGSAITISVVNLVMYNMAEPFRIRFRYKHEVGKELMVFGGSVFLARVVVYFLFNSDNFTIGSVKGTADLGYYATAFNWGALVCTLASSIVLSVLFPTFSQIKNDKGRLRSGYLRVIEYIALIGIVSNMVLFVVARDFLIGVLGSGTEKWMQSLSCLRIFCLYGVIRILLEPIGSVCLAIGRPGTMLKANLVAVCVQIAFVYPVLKTFGIEGVAVLITVAYGLQYFIYISETYNEIGLTTSDVLKRILPSVVLLPLASLAILDHFHQYTMLWLITKIAFTLGSCMILHGIITKWRLEKEIGVLVFGKTGATNRK
jgi:O-antigen/teichoic acid export membrane protein